MIYCLDASGSPPAPFDFLPLLERFYAELADRFDMDLYGVTHAQEKCARVLNAPFPIRDLEAAACRQTIRLDVTLDVHECR